MASNNNNGMFDPYGLEEMFSRFANVLQGQNETLANNEFARETKEKIEQDIKNVSKMTEDEIRKAVKLIETLFISVFGRNSNVHKFFGQFTDEMLKVSKNLDVSSTLFANRITSASSLLMQLSRSGNAGFFNLNKKGLDKNVTAQQLMTALLPEMGKKMDSVADKLIAFFGEERKNSKTKTRQFIEDLIEGLSRSKFIGGAFTDLIRLATFFAASWVKQFGPLGKALAVGLVALGPVIGLKIADVLTKALVNGLTNVVKASFVGLGTLLKGLFLSYTNKELLTSTLRGAPTVARGSINAGNLALGSFLAAAGVGAIAADTWKQSGTRNKWAGGIMGLGAAGFGTAGFASLLTPLFPLLAPVAPIALAVAGIATGVGLIVKFWPQIMDFFKGILQFLGLIAKEDKENGGYAGGAPTVFENLNKDFAGERGVKLKSKSANQELSARDLEAWNKANKTQAIIGGDGSIRNFGQMTQQQAGREMERLRKENPEAWNRLYEYIPFEGVNGKIYGNKSDFGTDLISPDGKGFYMAKGSMARMDAANAALESKGYRGTLTFSGGIATAGNFDTLQASPHKLTGKGHDSPYGAKFDIGQSSINQAINERGQRASLATVDWAIKQGWENAHISNEGNHRDVLWVSGDTRTSVRDAKKNREDWMEAARKTIAVRRDELLKEEQKAKAEDSEGGINITENEKALISKKYQALDTAKQDLKTLQDQPASFFTGNDSVSRILKDTIIAAQYEAMQR